MWQLFQKATDATEHSQCDEIVATLCSMATALATKTSPYLRHSLLAWLYEYIQNRLHDLDMMHLVNKMFDDVEGWSCIDVERHPS